MEPHFRKKVVKIHRKQRAVYVPQEWFDDFELGAIVEVTLIAPPIPNLDEPKDDVDDILCDL